MIIMKTHLPDEVIRIFPKFNFQKMNGMNKSILLAVIVLLQACLLSAQENIQVSRKEFRTDQPGFDAAWKHIKDGDSFYSKGGIWYARAYDEYKLAYSYNRLNAALNYKLGVSALFSDRKEEAADYLGRAFGLNNEISSDILLLSGRALIYAGRYREAEGKLKAYLEDPYPKSRQNIAFANRLIEECSNVLILTRDTVRVEIKNLGGNVNSNADDYSPVLTSDAKKMFFASRRPRKDKQVSKYRDTKFDENIYVTEYNDGKWSVAVPGAKNLNTEYCEIPLFIDNSGSLLYIYAGFRGRGDIMVSEFRKGDWRVPEPVKFGLNSDKTESSFAISPDGREIAFVSDRGKKGLGGKDIYFMERSGKKWKHPVNAGDSINSPNDEESVRYSKGGDTIWFSSRGHNTLGGFDIFYSIRRNGSAWGKAKNAGFPLNTAWNELYYAPSPLNDSIFYFASDRSGGMGGYDIYSGRILPVPPVKKVEKPAVIPQPPASQKHDTIVVRDTVVMLKDTATRKAPVIQHVHDTVRVRDTVVVYKQAPVVQVREKDYFLKGKITDSENGSPVIAKIDIIDDSTGTVIATTASSDADGSYTVKLPGKRRFSADIRATGYLADAKKFNMTRSADDSYTLNSALNRVKVGKKVVMKNIFFEAGKSILTTGSYAELDKLVKVLEDNQGMKIEISGHTDNTGSPVVNARLSTERARAVVEYISGKGVERSRLTYVGYGADQPVADNSTEAGRAKNRRVEFKILEF